MDRFEKLYALVGSPPLDLPLPDWERLYELTVGFRPDLVVELGRGYGNSTCVFVEAANQLRARVVSVGNDGNREWETGTMPRLRPFVGRRWPRRLTVIHDDILAVDYQPIVADRKRVLVYWDAHGVDVAEAVFDRLFPLLPASNLVIVDDVWAKDGPHLLPPEHYAGPFAALFDEVEPLARYIADNEVAYTQHERCVSFQAVTPHTRTR